MPTLLTKKKDPLEIYYRDSKGRGRPIVFIHGWPGSEATWNQVTERIQEAGYRAIAYDRRGFGLSEKAGAGCDYDTFAGDLDDLINHLDLHDAVLVGFSMGGGEVARYLGSYDGDRVSAACFVSAITPCLDATLEDNPKGAFTAEAAQQMQSDLLADPEEFLRGFLTNFYSAADQDKGSTLMVAPAVIERSLAIAQQADIRALSETIPLWLTDFRPDLAKLNVPVLVIHGEGDQVVPFSASGARMPEVLSNVVLEAIQDGPHGLLASHPAEVSRALLEFLHQN